MAERALPDFLTLPENRDATEVYELATRRVFFALLSLTLLLALLNLFGQRPSLTTAHARAATLEVSAPTALRGGLFFQGRFHVHANREIAHATLVLDKGWLEQMHINTIEPAPVGESSRDGLLALDFGHVAAGDSVTAYLQFQVNPTNVARRSQDVWLYDDDELLATVDRDLTVLP